MRQAASPHWRSAPPSWGQRAHDTVGRGGRSPEDTAEDTPRRSWNNRAASFTLNPLFIIIPPKATEDC